MTERSTFVNNVAVILADKLRRAHNAECVISSKNPTSPWDAQERVLVQTPYIHGHNGKRVAVSICFNPIGHVGIMFSSSNGTYYGPEEILTVFDSPKPEKHIIDVMYNIYHTDTRLQEIL